MDEIRQQQPEGQNVPDEFVEQVKLALEHLYDFPYLQQHPLVQFTNSYGQKRTGEAPAQRMRNELLWAIEALSPGPGMPFRAPDARLHSLLQLHYVEGRTIQETAAELGISPRQVYRDLRRGEESVAAILWAKRPAPAPVEEPRAARLSSVQVEMARLEPHPRPIDVTVLLQQALQAVERLAGRQSVTLRASMPALPLVVSADPLLAQQVFINLLSHAVQQARPGELSLLLATDKEGISLALRYARSPASDVPLVDQLLLQLTGRLGWTLTEAAASQDVQQVTLHMPTGGPTVLVIDDNEGLVELLDRFLTGQACRVLAATSGQEGLRLAQEMLPDAIILDVMMPEIDGWQLLQKLRAFPDTAATPVIICSVFNDPELAYSLGASLFLAKPVNREKVLRALRQLGIV